MSLDGLIVAFGIVAFFALVVLFTTPGLVSRIFDAVLRLFFSYRDIRKPDGRLYLRRFYITPRSWLGYDWKRGRSRWPRVLGWVPVTYRKIFVHHILLSDERTPHDHPWDFTTRILAGMYVEHIGTQGQRARCGSFGSVLRNHAGHVHALEIIRPVWSLVCAGESRRVWGFWSHSDELGPQWTDWRTFLKCDGAPTEPEDEIDPDLFPEAAVADHRFFIDSLFGKGPNAGSRLQPTSRGASTLDALRRGLDAQREEVGEMKALGTQIHEEWLQAFAVDGRMIQIETTDDCAIPIRVEDEITTRKIITSGPAGSTYEET